MRHVIGMLGIFIAMAACAAAGPISTGSAALTASSKPASTSASTSAPAQLAWGTAVEGLQLSLSAPAEVSVGGKCVLELRLRNSGKAAVAVWPGGEAEIFAWAFVATEGATGYFTDKLSANLAPKCGWPTELAPGTSVTLAATDISTSPAHTHRKGDTLRIVNGYPEITSKEKLADFAHALPAGPAKVRVMLYLPGEAQGRLLTSNTVEVAVAPPALDKLSDEARATYLQQLYDQFAKDAWSGQKAHAIALKLGRQVVPDLIEQLKKDGPVHGRMWMATAVADLGGDGAAEALVSLLGDKESGVRNVVAYHGPKVRSDKLDAAIIERGAKAGDEGFTAYALLGFLVFRGTAQPELLKAGLESSDGPSSQAAQRVLKTLASKANVERLTELSKSPDAKVAAAAAKVLAAMKSADGK